MPNDMTDSPPAASQPPVDLATLRGQTGGDAALEREVLALFLAKSERDLRHVADAATAAERRMAAHSLCGSARAIGAHAVAAAAAAVERETFAQPQLLRALDHAVAAAAGLIRKHLAE
jgi:HPt (histidine-containing phosphotransfer) domain-containing protein